MSNNLTRPSKRPGERADMVTWYAGAGLVLGLIYAKVQMNPVTMDDWLHAVIPMAAAAATGAVIGWIHQKVAGKKSKD